MFCYAVWKTGSLWWGFGFHAAWDWGETYLFGTADSGMPANGNLLISGSQEMRVNYELRILNVSGIVRPRDIARDNTIIYDKVAEARISYGGRGRLMEVQQPALVHQIYDIVRPF